MNRPTSRTRRTRTALTPFVIMEMVDDFRREISSHGHAPSQFVMARRFAKDLAEQNYTHAMDDLAREEAEQARRDARLFRR